MTKREYLNLCMTQSESYLLQCLKQPSIGMRPIHLALIRIALRHKRGKP